MTFLSSLLGVSLVLALVACGDVGSDDVTVMRGAQLAPPAMTAGSGADARCLSESELCCSCRTPCAVVRAPSASAEQDDDGILRPTTGNADEDACTDDANPYIFLVTDVAERPSRLVVTGEAMGKPMEIDLSRRFTT